MDDTSFDRNMIITVRSEFNPDTEINSAGTKSTERELAEIAEIELMYLSAEIWLALARDPIPKPIADHLDALNALLRGVQESTRANLRGAGKHSRDGRRSLA